MLGVKKRYVFLASFLLFCGLWFLLVSWPALSKYPPYRYYKISAKVDKEGHSHDIVGRIACKNRRIFLTILFGISGSLDFEGSGVSNNYKPTAQSLGYRFSDGEGLILRPDGIACTGRGYIKGAKDYTTPVVYWLDDSENPTTIEGYFLPSYFERQNVRIRLSDFKFDEDGTSWFQEPTSDLENDKYFSWLKDLKNSRFVGYVATFSNANSWGNNQALVESAAQIKSMQHLPYDYFSTKAGEFLWNQLLGKSVFCRADQTKLDTRARNFCRISENSYGVDVVEDSLVIEQTPQKNGLVVLKRETNEQTVRRRNDKTAVSVKLISSSGMSEEFHGEVYPRFDGYFFSPQRRQFFKIEEMRISRHYLLGFN